MRLFNLLLQVQSQLGGCWGGPGVLLEVQELELKNAFAGVHEVRLIDQFKKLGVRACLELLHLWKMFPSEKGWKN